LFSFNNCISNYIYEQPMLSNFDVRKEERFYKYFMIQIRALQIKNTTYKCA